MNNTPTRINYKGEIIKLVDYGIANRFGHHIEVHKKIYEKYPELFESIVEHEKLHTKHLSWKDILIDSYRGNTDAKQMRQFLSTTPRAWVQFIPIWIKLRPKFDVIINPMQLVFWIFILGFIGILWLIV